MKSLLLIFAAFATAVLCYDEKFDKVDIEAIINDDPVFDAYILCLLDKGPCDLEHSADFKSVLPEIVETACAKCSPIQRERVRALVKALQTKRPQNVEEFHKKYDPAGSHLEKFSVFALGTD